MAFRSPLVIQITKSLQILESHLQLLLNSAGAIFSVFFFKNPKVLKRINDFNVSGDRRGNEQTI